MSASKKKMQRREAVNTEQLTEEQIKQAEYKKKARLYTIIGIVVVVLVAALLVWNSGIFQKNATAATVGGEKLSVAELSYYYYTNDYYQTYAYYGISEDDIYNEADGTTFGDFYLDIALSNAQLVNAVYNEALANGHSDADVKDEVAANIESMEAAASANGYSFKAYLKAVMGRYMTPAVYKDIVTRSLVASHYAQELQLEKYDSYTVEELEAYYADHKDDVDTFTYSYLYFLADTVNTKDADGNELSEDEIAALKEAAMADAKAEAEAALAGYNSGTSIADLIESTTPSTSADHTTAVGTSAISASYKDELLELDIDKAAIVEYEGYGYYVVVYHGRERNETLSANFRHILSMAETTTGADGKLIPPTDAAMTTAKADAEAILAEFEAGAQTPDAFAALANKYSDDAGSNTNGGLYEGVVEGYLVPELDNWLFGEKAAPIPGKAMVIRHDGDANSSNAYWGYHVAYLDSWGEATWLLNVRSILTNEFVTEWQEGLIEANPAELTSAAQYICD